MPWFLKNDHVKLRKSEKNKSTDILFSIGEKQLKKLNFHTSQQFYSVDLIDYPEFNKIKMIKLLKTVTKKSIPELQKCVESLPFPIITQIPLKEAKSLETNLLNLACIARIY